MAPLRGTVSFVAVCDVTPAGRFRTSSPTSPLKSFNETRLMEFEYPPPGQRAPTLTYLPTFETYRLLS
jgi:hypothetical protein